VDSTAALLYITYGDETSARKYAQRASELDPGNVADMERDMAHQRTRLAARPKDAPLELRDASR